MPKSSELFPRRPTTTPGSTGADGTPPKIVLLDEPSSKIENGTLTIKVRTLLIDDGVSTVQGPSNPPTETKPSISWVGHSPSTVSTWGEEPMKVEMKISDPASPPKIFWVGHSPASVSTWGEEPMKVQVRIEE